MSDEEIEYDDDVSGFPKYMIPFEKGEVEDEKELRRRVAIGKDIHLKNMRLRAKAFADVKNELKKKNPTGKYTNNSPEVKAKIDKLVATKQCYDGVSYENLVTDAERKREELKKAASNAVSTDSKQKIVKPKEVEVEEPQVIEKKKKSKKKVIYIDSSDSSDSDSEKIVIRKSSKKNKYVKQEPPMEATKPTYQWSPEDIEEMKQRELEARLKRIEEQDEFQKMEKAMLQKRYADKLKEVQRTQLMKYMFGGK